MNTKHPFSMGSEFYDHESGQPLNGYTGFYYLVGDMRVLMKTWHTSQGERAHSCITVNAGHPAL